MIKYIPRNAFLINCVFIFLNLLICLIQRGGLGKSPPLGEYINHFIILNKKICSIL